MITIKWNNVFSHCFSIINGVASQKECAPIAVNRLGCTTYELIWSVELRCYRFQLSFVCGYFAASFHNATSWSRNCNNGVRQDGILSSYLFNIYMDQLSVKLNQLDIGCCIGDKCLNNLVYADDIYCFAPSFKGLQRLVDTCVEFAAKHSIVFNTRKTKAMYFPCKFFKTTDHILIVNDQHVEFVNSIKYLGVTISSVLSDELDIKVWVRSIYCIANMLRTAFFKWSVNVKKICFVIFVSLFTTSIFGVVILPRV